MFLPVCCKETLLFFIKVTYVLKIPCTYIQIPRKDPTENEKFIVLFTYSWSRLFVTAVTVQKKRVVKLNIHKKMALIATFMLYSSMFF